MKKHLKRIAAPSTWAILRKSARFVTRPKGPYELRHGISLITLLKDVLHLGSTNKECKLVLHHKQIAVNSVRRRDGKFMLGLMDVLHIKDTNETYRVLINPSGKLQPVPIQGEEVSIKPCKVIGKRVVKNSKVQLALHDGAALIASNDYRTGDTVVLKFPKTVASHIKLAKGSLAYLTGGSHVGKLGKIVDINAEKAVLEVNAELVEAKKGFVFVIGEGNTPVISLFKA